MKTIIAATMLLIQITVVAQAGETDTDGGHIDNQTNEYRFEGGLLAGQSFPTKEAALTALNAKSKIVVPPSTGNRRWYYCWTDASGGWHIDPQPPTDDSESDMEMISGATTRQIAYSEYRGILQAGKIHRMYEVQEFNQSINRIDQDFNKINRDYKDSVHEITDTRESWLKDRKDYYQRDCINKYIGKYDQRNRASCEQGEKRMDRYLKESE